MKKQYLSEIMDELGISKFTIKILIIIGIAMVFDGFDYMIVSYTMPQIAAEWGLDSVKAGSLSSWSLLGLVIGGSLSGIIADRYGRKNTLIMSTVLYSFFSILTFFASGYEIFSLCRVLTGAGLGACIPMANTINSEYAPTKVRGLFIALGMAFMILGQILAGFFAMFLIPLFGWRISYLIGGVPIFYAIVIHFVMPESALWLIVMGRKDKAITIIKMMERSAGRQPHNWKPDDILVPAKTKTVGVRALFSKSYVLSTVGLWINAFFIASVMYGINAWTPSMLLMSGFDTTSSYGFTIVQSAAAMIATCLAGLMIERRGRIKGSFVAFSLAIVACISMSFALSKGHWAIFAGCILIGFSVNFAITCPKSLTPELFPTEFRGTAIAFSAAFGRIGGFCAPLVFGIVVGYGMSFSQLMLMLVIPLLLSVAALFLCIRKETKGISIEELHQADG
jgi:MFS family permease